MVVMVSLGLIPMEKYGTDLLLQQIVGHLLYPSCRESVPEA